MSDEDHGHKGYSIFNNNSNNNNKSRYHLEARLSVVVDDAENLGNQCWTATSSGFNITGRARCNRFYTGRSFCQSCQY